jgi:hypothetical protein
LFTREVEFLGHTVSKDGIATDSKKIKTVAEMENVNYIQGDEILYRSFWLLKKIYSRLGQDC